MIAGLLFAFFFDARKTKKAFGVAAAARAAKEASDNGIYEAIVTQAAGYGFEVGAGQALQEVVQASSSNPFLQADWRDQVIKNA